MNGIKVTRKRGRTPMKWYTIDLHIHTPASSDYQQEGATYLDILKQAELRELESRREDYLASLDDRMGQLTEQLRAFYRAGRQSRMKLVLNQDDPIRIGRMLAYYDYLNRAQVEKISGLRQVLETLDQLLIVQFLDLVK